MRASFRLNLFFISSENSKINDGCKNTWKRKWLFCGQTGEYCKSTSIKKRNLRFAKKVQLMTDIKAIEGWIKNKLRGENSGHDWSHISRVRKLSIAIAKEEQADLFITEVSALVHDLIDEKLSLTRRMTEDDLFKKLLAFEIDPKQASEIIHIASVISFRKEKEVRKELLSKEAQVVQDADRLDAIGAIGIGRAFLYGGSKGHAFYDDGELLENQQDVIGHFYDKLLLLKNRMNTKTASTIAEKRHSFMVQFLNEFYEDCNS
jgi:uncharacterized protein